MAGEKEAPIIDEDEFPDCFGESWAPECDIDCLYRIECKEECDGEDDYEEGDSDG